MLNFRFAYIYNSSEGVDNETKTTLKVWSWPDPESQAGSLEPLNLTMADAKTYSLDMSEKSPKGNHLSLSSTRLKNGRAVYLINCSDKNFASHSVVIYDPQKGKIIFEEEFDDRVEIDGVCNGRALIRKADSIDFFCLDSLKVVESFKFNEIAGDAVPLDEDKEKSESGEDFVVRSKFDCNPARKQFVIYSRNLSFYQLMSYDEGFTVPTILYRGSTVIYGLHSAASLRQAVLMNGILFVAPVSDVHPTFDDPINDIYWPDPRSATITALDLKSTQNSSGIPFFTSQIMVGGSERGISHYQRPLLNGLASRFPLRDSKLSMLFATDEKLLVDAGRRKIVSFDFSKTSREVAELEATQFFDEEQAEIARIAAAEEEKRRNQEIRDRKRQEESERKEKLLNEKREKLEKMKEKYAADIQITGKIDCWKTGFGFLKGSGEASELGSVFVHISAFENRSEIFIRQGMPVFFRVEFDPERQNFRAKWAQGLEDNSKPQFLGSARGSRGKRGHRRGGSRGGKLF